MLQEAGIVLHRSKSGRLILKALTKVEPGSILVDSKGKKVAKVVEMIGPVNSPYISTIPLTDRVNKLIGSKLYVSKVVKKV
ncbi:MAG: Gar1/Naf1 family protein [Nitrososphaerota archaeon]|nr:Gar1/Naf1 family protein [Nitrososphaerota archaeon]